jgi:hypothetical protein
MREFRGRLGEFDEAFARGRDETMVFAPKEVTTQRGVDLVTYASGSDRIKLIDNKSLAAGGKVAKVSALEENLPQNLNEVVHEVAGYASSPDVPPVIAEKVLPRLRDAAAEVGAHADALTKGLAPDAAKAVLRSEAAQKDFAAILDRHGIDRVITTTGSGTGVTAASGLKAKGFQ